MGFVKSVAGELLHKVENIRCQLFGKAFTNSAIHKEFALLGHLISILFTHGTTQQISTTQGIAAHLLSDLHHLLLIENNAVGGLQGGL